MKLFTKHFLILSIFTTLVFTQKANAKIIYVDPATGQNFNNFDFGWGLSWNKPCKDLVHALYWAAQGDEIWLNTGTYYPVQAGELGNANADRNKSFNTHSNVKIYGGFSIANGATTMGTRNAAVYTTTLSGDIQLDGIHSNNSYTLIKTFLGNGFSVLDGVTITGANGGSFPNYATYGGGMYLYYVSPTISNCRFTNNKATQGGAVFCEKSNPTFTACTFSNNTVAYGNGFLVYVASRGGAVYNAGSSPTFNNCNFIANNAVYDGTATGSGIGASVCNDEKFGASSPTFNSCSFTQHVGNRVEASAVFTNGGSGRYNGCTFEHNSVIGVYTSKATDVFVACVFQINTGGAIRIEEGSTKVYNCLINNNGSLASLSGGVILYNTKTPLPVISNCLITGNASEMGGGICNFYSTAIINNCTISGNISTNKGGGGVYNNSRGYNGVPSLPLYYSTSTSYQNCIVYGNTITGGTPFDSIKNNFYTVPLRVGKYIPPSVFYDVYEYTYRPTIANCLIGTMPVDSFAVNAGIDEGGNILNVNPKFVNPAAGNFTIDNCSRAMDGGRNEFIPVSSPTSILDLNNQTRIINGLVDIGCYEKQSGTPNNVTNININICQGQSVVINGQSRSQSGTYTRVLTAVNGCDSVINTILVVNPLPAATAIASNNCFATGTLELKPTVGIAPFSVTLNSTTRNNIQVDSSASFPNLNAGTYNYSITDNFGCIGTGNAVLTTNILNSNIIYVDSLAQGDNSGRNFANAVTSLQKALDLASCTGVTQIWVAKGTYFPSKNIAGQTTSSRFATFRMLNGITIYGGFNQLTGDTTLARRNWKLHATILSGDIQQDGNTANDIFNVVNNYGNGLNNTAVLDGFTITKANNTADFGGGITFGGGMTNNGSSPTIRNCIFTHNLVTANQQAFGGAMYNINCAPIISNCQFLNNRISASYIAFGGAIYNDNSAPVITNCTFGSNVCEAATNRNGAAISSAGGTPITISNCFFGGNFPGAINLYANSAIVTNSTFFSNPGISTMAGGVNSVASSNPVITNCILVGNSGNISNTNSTPVIKNSLIGGSNGSGALWNTAFGTDAGGNIDADPQFTTDFRLSPCSPAKDAGNNTGVSSVDLDNNPRIVGTTVDMGCYEFQTTLSAYGSIVYVNASATGLNNGTSWANAFTDLSDALKLTACSGINTIYVSKGTYYASLNNSYGLAGDYQEPTFALRNGISILGGFSVADGATTLASRNYTLYKTILSGDANKDGILENNGKAVVTALAGVTSSTILDGLTIQEGYNNTTGAGAGMYIHTASPTINNCTFTGNAISFATGLGAGVYVNAGNPVFNNCKFYFNTITSTTASTGGGVYNVSAGATFNDCEFKGNIVTSSSNAFGAGINNYSCNTITINRCKFEGNIANAPNNAGAGIYATISAPMLVDNCLFNNNVGGALCTDNSGLGLTNSTIINNTTSIINYSGGYLCLNSTPTITNCIFYNNNNGNIVNVASIPVIKNSLIQGSGGSTAWVSSFGTDAGGNKDQNPLLTADFRLTACSPAVDAGHNAIASSLDLDKNIRIRNTTVDMGCYESNINTSIYGSRVYVDAAATGNNDGTSWANAFTDLQTALGIANCTGITEMYVSKGTYYPTNDLNSNAVNNQFATFQMKNNLSILGGFSVADGVTSLAQRNPSLYVTTLSGDIQNDNLSSNNVFNIINNFEVVLDTTAILDGFTVSGAYNNITGLGGGVINRNSSPKFLNCTFKDNFAGGTSTARGGGVHNINSSPIFRNCTFTNNNVSGINNGFGAGLSNDNSSPKISRCKFTNNTAQAPNAVGGGMYSNGGYGIIDNTLFSTNTGGAICADGSVLSMFNSTIAGNYGNTTTPGGLFLINGSGWYIANSIIYGNTLGAVTTVSSSPTFFYSNVEGSMPSSVWNNSIGVNGGGNRDIDPQFTPDYHLSICSPLVNGGDNGSTNGATIDLDNTTRIKSALVDFGCYESVYSNVMVYSTRLYVNAANTNTVKDGNSWGTAFTSLEDALTFSRSSCVTITEIYVSKGTYYPINNTSGVAVNNQYSCFQMKNNLSIIGGFSVADGITTLAARNPTLYPATLSGDIQQDGVDGNNVYNVINNFNTGIDTTAVLDGFYITGAWNNITGLGGGVINANTSPKFINCTIWGNFAGGTTTARGAGMHNINASPIIRKCSFVANNASSITAAFGAGLSNDNSFPKIEQCVFKDNIVNAANPAGGGMYSNGAGGSISNSLFTGNNGTAICADASIYTLYNTTIANNNGTPSLGRAGGLLLINSNFNILNSIVYGNSNGSVTNWSSTPTFYYSNVEGSGAPASWDNSYGINGGGNTSSNPLFTSDFRLQACSPLINAGDGGSVFGSVDLDNTARIKNGVLDVGCYETADIRPAILSAPEPAATFGSNTVTLNATVNGSNSINWYTSPTGGTSLFTGTSFTTPAISTSTYYYVEASNGSCATMPRVAIRAAVFPMYYSTGSNDAATLSNWNTQSNGTGNTATSFTDTARFIVQTGHILTLNGNNNLSFANNLLTIQANASMAINGTGSIQLAGNLVNDGIITGTGVVELNGSSAQIISGTGTISNLAINNAAGVSLLNAQKITGTLTPTLGVLTTNGNLTLTSNANGTARIAAGTGNYIIGNVTVERFIPAGKRGFRFLTPTVTTTNFIKNNWQEGANNTSLVYANNQNPLPNYGTHITGSTTGLNGFDATLTGNPSLMQFDNATQTWNTGIANTNATNLIAGNAYRLMVRGDRSIDLNTQPANTTATTLRATGTLLTGAVTLSNSASTPLSLPTLASNASEYSFIGNPYASSIDWNALGKTGLTGYYYIWDPTLGTRGAYVSCFTDGTKSNGSSNITTAIQSGQAFFVQNTSAPEARQLTINEAHKTTGNTNVFRMQTGTATMGIQLYLTANINGASQDGATILFNNNHSNLVNDDDANKFANLDENIAIQKGNSLMSIERRSIPATTDTIQLKAWQLMQSNYTLRIASANFNGTVKAYLLDKFLNTETLLNLNGITDVNFSTKSSTASIASDRFSIVFREVSLLPVSITNVSASQMNAGIEIVWNTANETNMSSYEVEKSIDGNSFSKATTVVAKNVSVSTNSYSWFDAQVNQGNNYYRIKAVEKNGKYQYTQIVKVYIGSKAPSFTVYPNPVIGKTVRLLLSNVEMGVYTVRIFNSLGQEVASQSINHYGGSIIETIPLGKIAAGNYSMQIMNGTKTVTTKTIMIE